MTYVPVNIREGGVHYVSFSPSEGGMAHAPDRTSKGGVAYVSDIIREGSMAYVHPLYPCYSINNLKNLFILNHLPSSLETPFINIK